jgi:hypothetical protein
MIPFKIGYCINYTKSQRDVMLVEVIESLTNKLHRSEMLVLSSRYLPTFRSDGACLWHFNHFYQHYAPLGRLSKGHKKILSYFCSAKTKK